MQQLWVAGLRPGHTADGTALASSSALTDISPTPNIVVPANFLVAGSILRVTAAGRFGTTGTPTLLIGAYIGGVAGAAAFKSDAITTISGASASIWRLEGLIFVRSDGSSGTVMGIGSVQGVSAITAIAPAGSAGSNTPAVATWDTTAAKALTIGAQWSTGTSASNTITCHQFTVESLV